MPPVAIIGASGYTGRELVRILVAHPAADLVALLGSDTRSEPVSIADAHPSLRGVCDLDILPLDLDALAASAPAVVFLATPHEASAELAPRLLELGAKVFDLSGAFRLPAEAYPEWYGFTHPSPALTPAVYGLAERNAAAIADAELVAVPGCYPTAAGLALEPLTAAGVIDTAQPIIIDATSGVSGAGRKAVEKTSFSEVSLSPYNVLKHRHAPEIVRSIGADAIFTPHLGAFDRGILATMHAALEPGVSGVGIAQALANAYHNSPFVRLLPPGSWPSVKAVELSNFCDIQFAVDEERSRLVICSALDNLVKGASGQAVQCMNIALGLPETLGLLPDATGVHA